MKKVILAVLVFLSISNLVNAQSDVFRFGIKVGASSSSIKAKDLIVSTKSGNSDSLKIAAENAQLGLHFGIFTRITVKSIYLQPELLFSTTGGKVTYNQIATNTSIIKTQNFNRIDIPVMVGKKWKFFRAQAGPIASFIINSKSELSDIEGLKAKFNNATWGFQAGIGFDILKDFSLDIKYEGGLSKLGKGVEVGGQLRTFDQRQQQLVASFGYSF